MITLFSKETHERLKKAYSVFSNTKPEREINIMRGNYKQELSKIVGIYNAYFKHLENPDEIFRTKNIRGVSYSKFYDNIVNKDAHIASVINTRKLAVSKLNIEVIPYTARGVDEPTAIDAEIADTVDWAIKKQAGFGENVKELLSAFEHGYSVSEMLFDYVEDTIIVTDIKHRKPEYFKFNNDDELLFDTGHNQWELMPENKFIVHTHNKKYENPYGNSILKNIYWAHWFKSNMIKFMMIFMERMGQPLLIGKHPPHMSDNEITDMMNQLLAIQNNSVGVVPDGVNIELLEAKFRNEDGFKKVIEYFDDEISKGVLGQTLTSSEGRRSGSLSLGEVHNMVREDILEDDANSISNTLTAQFSSVITKYNYGDMYIPPRIKPVVKRSQNLSTDADTHTKLVGIGLEIPKSHVREHFNIPVPAEGEEVLEKAANPFMPPIDDKKDEDKKFGFEDADKRMYTLNVPDGYKTYDAAILNKYYDELHAFLLKTYRDIFKNLNERIAIGTPMHGLIDQAVSTVMNTYFLDDFANHVGGVSYAVAENIATKFGGILNENLMQTIKGEYLSTHFYDKGTIEGIRETMINTIDNIMPNWENVKFDVKEMKSLLKKQFPAMSNYKADMISRTEISNAAHSSMFETIEKAGLGDRMEAWFLVDPISCDLCQDWASRNPYSVAEAKSMGMPHIQCNDQWTLILKEGV